MSCRRLAKKHLPWSRRQDSGGVDDLWTEAFDLRSGDADELDTFLVVGHGAGEIRHFDELVGVLREDLGVFLHFPLVPVLRRLDENQQRNVRLQKRVGNVVHHRLLGNENFNGDYICYQ